LKKGISNKERRVKKMMSLIVAFCAAGLVTAADHSEQNVYTSPATVYSGGLAIGSVVSLDPESRIYDKEYLKITFSNTFNITDRLDLFFDIDWLGAANFGTDIGFDFYLMKSRFRPFAGLGVGVQYFDKNSDNIGPSGTMHVGFALDVTENMQVRFRVPLYAVATQNRDRSAGLDVGFLFSKGYKKVKKLNYNQ
jgi:hypothetical protein